MNHYLIQGYAALFNVRGDPRTGCANPYYVPPGAFQLSTATTPLIFAHDRGMAYASTGRGNLSLWQDTRGLAFEARLPMNDHSGGLVAGIRDGRYDQCSVEFVDEVAHFATVDGERVKVIESALVGEISICPEGACNETAVWLGNVLHDDLPPRMRQLARDWAKGWAAGNAPATHPPVAARPRRSAAPASVRATMNHESRPGIAAHAAGPKTGSAIRGAAAEASSEPVNRAAPRNS